MNSLTKYFFLILFLLPLKNAYAQSINVDQNKFNEQMLNMLHVKLLDKYEEIIEKVEKDIPASVNDYVDKRINKIESELLKMSHFDQLLYEFSDLGLSPDEPNISKSLTEIAKSVQKFQNTKGPITIEELKGYLDQWWKPAATAILDKESVEIISGIGALLSSAKERFDALRKIQLEYSELSEPELINKLQSLGFSGEILEKIKPLEQVLRSGWRSVPDPIGNYNLLHAAFSSDSPSAKIETLFALGSKYGGKVPILGQFIEPMFQLAEQMLSTITKYMGCR